MPDQSQLPRYILSSTLQVRLWDLRVNGCQALLQTPGLPTTAFDEQGLVFAVGAERGVVKLYDARNWGAGPFTSFPVRRARAEFAGGRRGAIACLVQRLSRGTVGSTPASPACLSAWAARCPSPPPFHRSVRLAAA